MTRPSLFAQLKAGLEDGISHEQGRTALKTCTLDNPRPSKDYGPGEVKPSRFDFR